MPNSTMPQKFSNYLYYGSMGYSEKKFTCMDKFSDPENPLFGTKIEDVSRTRQVTANFLLKFPHTVAMVTGFGVRQILLAQLNLPTPKTPCLVQKSKTYLLYMPSYSQFSVKISEFSLPW